MNIIQQNPDLIARLVIAQNAPANVVIDIMTFAGLCDSRAELERHVIRYEILAGFVEVNTVSLREIARWGSSPA